MEVTATDAKLSHNSSLVIFTCNLIVVASVLLCNLQFLIFHLYQSSKPFAGNYVQNENFLFSWLSITLQIGNFSSAFSLFSLLYEFSNGTILCVSFYVRGVTMQIQMSCLLMISISRFFSFFFPGYISKMNHRLIGYFYKLFIVLLPAYLQFVVGHVCGLQTFCSKDFSFLSYSTKSEYQQQLVNLNAECRKKIHEMYIPVPIVMIIITNGSIFLKLLLKNIGSFPSPSIAPLPIQIIELRTLSASQQSSTPEESESSQDSNSNSLSMITCMVTLTLVMINQINLMFMLFKTNILKSLLVDLLISTILPMGWCLANWEIFKLGGGRLWAVLKYVRDFVIKQ